LQIQRREEEEEEEESVGLIAEGLLDQTRGGFDGFARVGSRRAHRPDLAGPRSLLLVDRISGNLEQNRR